VILIPVYCPAALHLSLFMLWVFWIALVAMQSMGVVKCMLPVAIKSP
jgi:hypothetical protein